MKGSNNIPNSIPKSERVFNIIWGLGLLCYAFYSYQHGELYLPGKGSSDGVTFTGATLNIIITAMVLGALSLFVVVLDHYDKRNNEHKYKLVNRLFTGVGILLIVIAFIMEFNNSITYQVVG